MNKDIFLGRKSELATLNQLRTKATASMFACKEELEGDDFFYKKLGFASLLDG